MDDLASVLRRVRRSKRETQAEAALSVGTSQQNLANYESGRAPRAAADESYEELLRGLAAYLDTNVLEVLRLAYAPWAEPSDELIRMYERRIGQLSDEVARCKADIVTLRRELDLSSHDQRAAEVLREAPAGSITDSLAEIA